MESHPKSVEHDKVCLVSMAEEVEAAPLLSIALVSHDGTQPPTLTPLGPRVIGNLSAVRPTDDVVICYSDAPAADVAGLYRALGRDMPAVLVAARDFDAQDVITAFDHGSRARRVRSAGCDAMMSPSATPATVGCTPDNSTSHHATTPSTMSAGMSAARLCPRTR